MVEYRFNNGRGAVLCRVCRKIIDSCLSPAEASKRWKDGRDICMDCKEKENQN